MRGCSVAAKQNTYSRPGYWRPDVEGNTSKQISRGGTQVTNWKLSSGAGSAHVDIYDWIDDGGHVPPQSAFAWDLDCSTTNNDGDAFPYPLYFTKGVYMVLTQGANFGATIKIAVIPSAVS